MLDHAAVMGGAQHSLYDIARHFNSTVALFEDGPLRSGLAAAGVPVAVIRMPAALRRSASYAGPIGDALALPDFTCKVRRIRRIAKSHNLLYANSLQAFLVAASVGAMARRPVMWHLREMLSADYIAPHRKRLAAALSGHTRVRVVANSSATAQCLLRAGGKADRLAIVHNGIDLDPFTSQAAGIRRGLGLDGAPLIGMFGRLAKWKGQEVLLDALRLLPDVQALIVGTALFEDPAFPGQLRKRAAALGLARRVHFLGHRSDVPAVMQEVDVVVHASVAPEPFGRVVAEAMLAGRPVVAARAGGIPEIIEHGRTGLLVRPGDATELAGALGALLGNSDWAGQLGKCAADSARRRFGLPLMLRRMDKQFALATAFS